MIIGSKKRYKVHSLERGLDLIEFLAGAPLEISLKDLSHEVGFSMGTAHRILSALKSRGYVQQGEANSKYKLTFKLFELGNRAVEKLNIREEALPVLKDLAEKTGETAFLIVPDDHEGLCIERIEGYHYVKILALKIGGRMPLHMGGGPMALLAYLGDEYLDSVIKLKGLPAWTKKSITDLAKLKRNLRKIRKEGYSLSVGDVVEGAAAIGCPVRNWKGEVIAAISVSGSSIHFKKDALPRLIEIVKNSAEEISRRFGASN